MKKRAREAVKKPIPSHPVAGEPVASHPVASQNNAWQILSILLLVVIVGVVWMPSMEYPGDAMAVRMETVQLLNTGHWAIPPEIATQLGAKGQYFYFNDAKNAWYPKYGVLNTLMYLPSLYVEKRMTGSLDYVSSGRMGVLNLMDVSLSMLIAIYLFLFASRYTASYITRLAFVLGCLYCTYWWNYLRAPTFEAYQPLLFIACCYHFLAAMGRTGGVLAAPEQKAHAVASALFLGLLCLSKTVYALLWPLLGLLIVLCHWWPEREDSGNSLRILWEGARRSFWFVIPSGVLVGILLATNAYKFGSPFNTGYTQWATAQNLFGGNIITGIFGYLFDPQFNIFTNFPVLFIACVGMIAFVRTCPRDSLIIGCVALLITLVNSKFFDWVGRWCYGPRYMLPILPLISLPFITATDWLRQTAHRGLAWAGGIGCVLLLGYSFILQANVNALNFFTFYYLSEGCIDKLYDPTLDAYFKQPFGVINGDLLAYKHGKPLWWRTQVATRHPAAIEHLDQTLNFVLKSNLMFFPDPVRAQQ